MIKEKSVFVVHGRNKQARNAVFTFLRSIGLEPVDWTKAISLTGQASPYVFDIVKTGLEHAQCAVILFTPDDMAKLRTELAHEAFAFQPRPNVFFEAGMAMTIGGQEKTIIIHFEKLREITDLDGISFQLLSNDPQSRKAFIERLKIAGCQLNENTSEFLNKETGGDFELKFDSLKEISQTLERGEFTDYLVDSSISHSLNNSDLNTELCQYLQFGKNNIDLKFNYLGSFCASNWLTLTDDPSYGHSELEQIIKDSLSDIVKYCKLEKDDEIDLISLGPGDGKIDRFILRELQRQSKLINYYPLDISFDLLQKATSQILNTPFLPKTFRVKAIHGDFLELIRYFPIYGYDNSINFFSLLGYTLGNYNEGELIGKVKEGMLKGDFLLIDSRLHNFGPIGKLKAEEKAMIRNNYQQTNRFSFGAVESVTIADFRDASFDYAVSKEYTVVPNAVNLVTYCTNLHTKFRHNYKTLKRERLNLSLTTLYSFDDLSEWFEDRGFNIVWKKKVKDTGLFLLTKTED